MMTLLFGTTASLALYFAIISVLAPRNWFDTTMSVIITGLSIAGMVICNI